MRLLGAIRLSNLTDETTSPERQREQINGYANLHGHTVIDITQDLDVSGATSPFEREFLGPWLTEPDKINKWDGICVTKLDLLTRSLRDFDDFREWCDTHGKVVLSVAESLDLSTPIGRMFANLLAMFAEFERERMGERRREAAAKIAEQGGWDGGLVPFGYRAERNGKGWKLVLDEKYAPIVQRMADDLLAGRGGLRAIARWLNAEDIPTTFELSRIRYGKPKRGDRWATSSVRSILQNPRLTEPPTILDYLTWSNVQEAMEVAKGDRTSGPRPTRMLLRIVYCDVCGGILHGFSNNNGVYYICENKRPISGERCPARLIPADELEQAFDDVVIDGYGHAPHLELVKTQGRSYKVQIDKTERAIRTLDLDDPEYDAKVAVLRTERARLKGLQTEQAAEEWKDDGRTISDVWPTLDKPQKRAYALERRWRFYAHRDADGEILLTGEGGSLLPDIESLQRLRVPSRRAAGRAYL
jgi:DNA invertase Pin-like site-specific DNA recombinase